MPTFQHVYNGVNISVKPQFLEEESKNQDVFLFSYEITIINERKDAIQLLKRHWKIFDPLGGNREIQGDGVVGKQPILSSNEVFSYNSFCPIRGEIGTMSGFFLFNDIVSQNKLTIKIPEFELIVPSVLN